MSADTPPGRWLRVLAHPERVRILRYLLAHEEAAASDLARLWDTNLSALSYHFRALEAVGAIECRRRSQQRGALKRHFGLRDREAVSAALRLTDAPRPTTRSTKTRSGSGERQVAALHTVDTWVERLRRRRAQLGLSLAEVGRRSGIDVATLRRVEQRGSDPRTSVLIAYAEATGYPLVELFGDGADMSLGTGSPEACP